ncbi:MAG: glycosyltransferase family 2 protein, partial [Methanobacterium sp.]|nr:glycosyltransferase family 2 protein [Methanobacterium sp.]
MNPQVTVVLLNWNGWKDTIECLESFYQIDYPNYDIILVDNNSDDDSIERITAYCKAQIKPISKFYSYNSDNKPIKIFEFNKKEAETEKCLESNYNSLSSDRRLIIIKNDKNYGFAEGNNIGIRYALKSLNPKYVLLLNNDTVVDSHFLTELVKTGESNDKIAVVGPKTFFYDFNGKNNVIWSVGGVIDLSRYPGYHDIEMGHNNPPIDDNSTMEVGWVSGAIMLIKTAMLPGKLLNSEFFFGCEDSDICIEMDQKGYKMITNLNSIVWH